MNLVWGIVLIVAGLICWLGQVIAVLSPKLAVRLGLVEPETDVEPVFACDTAAEAIWDSLVTWTLPVAGILLTLENPWWPYFGLVGGGIYLYFSGRGIIVRALMRRRGFRIGAQGYLITVYIFLVLWGLIAVVTILAAANTLLPLQ